MSEIGSWDEGFPHDDVAEVQFDGTWESARAALSRTSVPIGTAAEETAPIEGSGPINHSPVAQTRLVRQSSVGVH